MLYDNKKIEDVEYEIYLKWFDEFVKDIPIKGVIYIKTDPEKCKVRVVKRNRKGETISLKYLQNCHNYHENWLNETNIPVLALNGNEDFITLIPKEWMVLMEGFMINLCPSLFCHNEVGFDELMDHPFF